MLVRDIGMVAYGGETSGFALGAIQVVGAEVDVVEFDVVLDMSSHRLLHHHI